MSCTSMLSTSCCKEFYLTFTGSLGLNDSAAPSACFSTSVLHKITSSLTSLPCIISTFKF